MNATEIKDYIKSGLSNYYSNANIDDDTIEILSSIIKEHHNINDFDIDDLYTALIDLESANNFNDFTFEFDENEYRIISDDSIERIYREEKEETIRGWYDLSNIPDFIEIDWDKTIDNYSQDGYGHHFSGYDGSEIECAGYYIFRTN